MLIAAEHVCKNYGLRQLLNDASLYVDSGDKIGIIGINGTGKSTLLRLLARTEEPDEGTVQRFPRVRAAYLAQNPEMDERATVLEQVLRSLPADAREAADYEARAMLMRLGIYDCIQRVGSLSGGRRQTCQPLPQRFCSPRMCCCWTSRPTTSMWRCLPFWRTILRVFRGLFLR